MTAANDSTNGFDAPYSTYETQGLDRVENRESSGDQAISRLVGRLTQEVGRERYDRFFAGQTQLQVDGGRLDVTVPSGEVAELLDRRFGTTLRRVARAELPASDEVGVRYKVDWSAFHRPGEAPGHQRATPLPSAPAEKSNDRAPSKITPANPPARSQPTPRRYRLDEFIVGVSNRLAYNAALQIAEAADASQFSPLFLHGPCGLGKTHLLHGIAARFTQLYPGRIIRCTTGEAFTNEFIVALKTGKIEQFRRTYRRVDLLCIDDVHFLANKEATQAELLHTFDAIGLSGARTVLASDEHPREILKFSRPLISRFLAGMVVRIDPPDVKLRESVIRAFATRRGLAVEGGAIGLIAERTGNGSSIREIEGVITQVEAAHRLLDNSSSTTIGMLSVRTALGIGEASDRPAGPRRAVTIDAIMGTVCRELHVDPTEFAGSGRHKRVVLARALTVQIARELTTMSYPEIARAMRRPNHSTVITAHQRLSTQLKSSPGLDLGPSCGHEWSGTTLAGMYERLKSESIRNG